mgnify:CR=1 FL=1|tara:strand:- start:407730 stop:408851 length:1122 start_codon:yes stop_codon:yes gene_type:complete
MLSFSLFAYPNFIGMGYQSCLTCHYNPHGNGPLNDYGRALSASTISGRAFADSKITDEELAQKSGFMWQKPMADRIRPAINYRGLYLKRNFSGKNEETEWINMAAKANVVVRLGPEENKDKLIASATFGYAPTPRATPNSTEPNYRTREHYLGYRPTPNWGLYAGLMDKTFGLRVPDHIAFSRVSTGLTQNDQSHGVILHFVQDKFEIAGNYFIGNLKNEDDVRQKGFAFTGEYGPKDWRIGPSILVSESQYLKNTNLAAHARLAFGKGNSMLIELGQVTRDIIPANRSIVSRYGFFQGHILMKRGLYFLNTLEYFKGDTDKEDHVFRWGPGVQYFMMHGLELRTDIYNSRVFSSNAVSDDTWNLTAQIHLWL